MVLNIIHILDTIIATTFARVILLPFAGSYNTIIIAVFTPVQNTAMRYMHPIMVNRVIFAIHEPSHSIASSRLLGDVVFPCPIFEHYFSREEILFPLCSRRQIINSSLAFCPISFRSTRPIVTCRFVQAKMASASNAVSAVGRSFWQMIKFDQRVQEINGLSLCPFQFILR
jgi:hypothetical protein